MHANRNDYYGIFVTPCVQASDIVLVLEPSKNVQLDKDARP